MGFAEQGTDGGLFLAECQLACRGRLEAHLLLDIGGVNTVSLADLSGGQIDMEFGNEEQTESLGAGAGTFGAREHHVHDVVCHVVFAGGDEPLGPLDVPRSVAVVESLRAAGADVGASIGLGEHHRGSPLVVDHQPSEFFLRIGSHGVNDGGETGAGHVEKSSGVGTEQKFTRGPSKGWGCAGAAEVFGEVEPPPLGVHEGAE